MAYGGRFNVTLSTFLFILIHINPQARGQYLAVCEMQKYKFFFNTFVSLNNTSETDGAAVLAARESLGLMHSVNPCVRYVLVARVVSGGLYSVVGRYEF